MLKLCLLMAAILDGGRGHRTQFWKYTTQRPSMSFNIGSHGKKFLKSSPLKPVSQYSKHVIDGP
jgi:hypothetical protein